MKRIWRWLRSWRLVKAPYHKLADERVLQVLLYASRPTDQGLRRIWAGMTPEEAADEVMLRLGVIVDEDSRVTHGEIDEEGNIAIEASSKARLPE